jgi:hypothetical protein
MKKDYGLDEQDRKAKINRIIEELDDNIENTIKFEYARGLKCYCDIVQKVLSEQGKDEKYCQRLPLFLESGASDEKILFLIGAGLSRNTSIEIYRIFANGAGLPSWKSVTDTVNWLRVNKSRLTTRQLHRILYSEIERILG